MNTLPKPIADYVAAFNAPDMEGMLRSFTPDAVVVDENKERRGRDAIRAWIEETSAQYSPRVAVKDFTQEGNKAVMHGEVSGTFPGSPVVLRFAFDLKEGGIARLVIEA
jgi:uncharacterized protein (TIGR02246 family)